MPLWIESEIRPENIRALVFQPRLPLMIRHFERTAGATRGGFALSLPFRSYSGISFP
jgi:hypothetical protein